MVTLAPSSSNQFVVAVRAGLKRNNVEDKFAVTLAERFDKEQNKDLPNEYIIRAATGKDSALAAQYFIDMVSFFFEKVVGWDPIEKKSSKSGGIFGKPVAYAGGVETQGNSTLHGHFLIWLEGFAKTDLNEEDELGYNENL